MKLFYIIGVVRLATATTVLVPPDKTICHGDDVTFNCSVTLSTCGVLSWSVNNIAVGSFLDVTGQLGTRASNPDFPGVVASITDINVDANNISSSLTISSAGVNVPHDSQILCTDDNEPDQRNLVIAMIELITTVRPTLRSASVTVETRDHSALECIATYHVEVIPTVSVANQPPPPSVNSSENSITIHGLNFCKSNYTFRITVYGRNNITSNDTKSNVPGDVNALNILIEPLQNGSALQWDLMRSDHPENCDVMYEVMFNGKTLRLVSETEISQGELIREGFPFCQSTSVSVTPNVSAHGVIRTLTRMTTYLAIPNFSGPNNVKSIPTFVHKDGDPPELQVILNWDPVPPGTFGPDVNLSFRCGLVISGEPIITNCNSMSKHSFLVADKKPFGKTYSVIVRVDYLECRNLSSGSQNAVTAVITSFPKLNVKDTTIDIELDVNTTLVPDGSNVSVSVNSSSKMKPQKAVSDGKFKTTISDLQPGCHYDYNITISRNDNGAIIDRPIHGQFTTAEENKSGNNIIAIILPIVLICPLVLFLPLFLAILCIYWKCCRNKKKQDISTQATFSPYNVDQDRL